jgi:hypothetical protein
MVLLPFAKTGRECEKMPENKGWNEPLRFRRFRCRHEPLRSEIGLACQNCQKTTEYIILTIRFWLRHAPIRSNPMPTVMQHRLLVTLLSGVLLTIGLCLDQKAATYPLAFENHALSRGTNAPIEFQLIKTPTQVAWLKVVSTGLYAIAISLFISVVVIKRIEEARQAEQEKVIEKMREKIQEDVLAATMGKFIPSDIFSVIKRDILERSFVVRRGRWELDFNEAEGGRLKLLTVMSYEILNTREKEATESRHLVTKPIEEGGLQSLTIRVGGADTLSYKKGQKSDSGLTEEISNGTIKMNHQVTIPGQGTAELVSKYVDFYTETAVDTMFTHYPTQALEVLVRFPSGWTFDLASFATSPLECFEQDENRCSYRFKGGLLPCQGVTYSLHKKHDNNEHTSNQGCVSAGASEAPATT